MFTDDLHIPVLLESVLHYLDPQPGDSYLDLTAGYGGHASRILGRTGSPEKSVLVDRDSKAIRELQARFAQTAGQDADAVPTILHADFATATQQLAGQGRPFDCILADLGVSSPHLNQAARGFSLAQDGPLDMRMDQEQELSADNIVNGYSEAQLVDILERYGEEPKARAVARAIILARPVRSTAELASIVAKVWYYPGKTHSKVHPATRTFQAIRIAVNDELGQLEKSLPQWINLLTPGGRIAIVSFQSLEDRIVKTILSDKAGGSHGGGNYDSEIQLLTKRPITAESTELVHNPRSRSAKLRAAVKIKNK
ncbi:MAG TPA: 16S rRNA (cytosine(1402)-N(4))-methyltransferase RsmH [Candidatus Saccharimonadales bacterium]|jgi:16S rRNA (cytosine1402-N4)-methyltransferase